MSIPIDVPGLDRLLGEVAPGSLVVLEGGPDPAKAHLALRIGMQAARLGRPVRMLSVRGDAEESLRRLGPALVPAAAAPVASLVPVVSVAAVASRAGSHADHAFAPPDVRAVARWADLLPHVGCGADLVVDGFSLLAAGAPLGELTERLCLLRAACRADGTVAVLVLDDDVLPPAAHAVVQHLADGLLRFQAREDSDGLVHFLRVPRWTDGRVLSGNVHYSFDGRRLLIDTRQRVN